MILISKTFQNSIPSLLLAAAVFVMTACADSGSAPDTGADASPQDEQTTIVPVEAEKKPEPVSFNRDIRPILSDKCFFCHGPDPKTREADLRIDLFEAATEDLGDYAAIVPGDREASETWIRITDKADPMPPKKSHKKLSAEEIELIGRWIDEGAEYEEHWAYVAPKKPESTGTSAEDAIDRLILEKLKENSLKPSPPADKRTLMRRVTFDLTGLPPTPEQAKAFMSNSSPDAYEQYVDTLMASPAYGEHMAVWWMDLVRFADTIGYHSDNPRISWPYRDWVIKSFNENMPFDRFTVMQLAGDLMQDEPTTDMLVATSYIRLSPSTEEGGAQAKEYQAIYNAERVTNYGDVWLGSSIGCAQCHDHKFDPYTMRDFYSLAAFFGSINQSAVSMERGYSRYEPPFIFVPQNDEQAKEIAEVEKAYQAMIKAHPEATQLEEHLAARSPTGPGLPGGKMPEYGEQFKDLIKKREQLAAKIPTVPVSREIVPSRTIRVLARGNWQDDTGEIRQPATPEFLGGPASTDDNRLSRLDLAKWTVSPDNPLAARTVVNRLWGRFMGSPLSSNTLDLGSQGTAPTHPELLDELALDFVASGWDLKHAIKRIVTSKTYRQSSNARPELAQIDPDNTRLFARQSAVRLPAEVIRDQALAVSGLLSTKIGGPSVFPYQPAGHWEPLNFPARKWPTSKGKDLYRRGLYTWVQRTFPHPQMVTFDAPSRESCTGQRMISTTPLQSLALLNGPAFVESARVLAATVVNEHDADDKRLESLYQRTLARSPRDSERQALAKLLDSQRKHFAKSPEDAKKLISTGASPVAEGLDPVELAAWTSACRVVLNLHETITRN